MGRFQSLGAARGSGVVVRMRRSLWCGSATVFQRVPRERSSRIGSTSTCGWHWARGRRAAGRTRGQVRTTGPARPGTSATAVRRHRSCIVMHDMEGTLSADVRATQKRLGNWADVCRAAVALRGVRSSTEPPSPLLSVRWVLSDAFPMRAGTRTGVRWTLAACRFRSMPCARCLRLPGLGRRTRSARTRSASRPGPRPG